MLKLLSQINTDVISPAGVSCFYHNQYTSRTLVMVATLPTHTKKYIFFWPKELGWTLPLR